ncbi:MAG: hypothetical protein ABJA66_10315 [Actinomycetota bacterium]
MQILIKVTFTIFFVTFGIYSQQLSRPQKVEELRKLKTIFPAFCKTFGGLPTDS